MKRIKNFNDFLIMESGSAEKLDVKTSVIKKWASTKMETISDLQKFLKEYGTKVVDGKGGSRELRISGSVDPDTVSAFWAFWYGTKSMIPDESLWMNQYNPNNPKDPKKYPQLKTKEQLAKKVGNNLSADEVGWYMRKTVYYFIKNKNGANPIPPFPAKPNSIGSTNYYSDRNMDFKQRVPNRTPPDYYLSYGDKYVNKFKKETRPKMSSEGKGWLDRTLVNLQKAVEDKLKIDPKIELNSTEFRKYCFDSHPSAYIKAGLFNLGPQDLFQIAMTPEWRDLLTEESMLQILKIVKEWSSEKARQLMDLSFRVWNSAKGKFDETVNTVGETLGEWYKSAEEKGEYISDKFDDFMEWVWEYEKREDFNDLNLIEG